MKKKSLIYSLLCSFTLITWACGNNSEVKEEKNEGKESIDLLSWIQQHDELEIVDTLENLVDFQECYLLTINQPLDHSNPEKGTFKQRIFLSHRADSLPMTMETEGYNVRRNGYTSIAKILPTNQMLVEHRYFGESFPDSIDYQYLNIHSQIEDYHRIRTLFGEYYKNAWIATGISKGGENTIIYKSKYPKDIDVSVPEVAPIILSREDQRPNEFLDTVGSDECRQKIIDFQRRVLENREYFIPLIEKEAEEKGYVYEVGAGAALEYAVLEFSFAFWQWGDGVCDSIPLANASIEKVHQYLKFISPVSYFRKNDDLDRKSSNIMHMREYGYYAFQTKYVQDLLIDAKSPSNFVFAPQDMNLTYDPTYMRGVQDWLDENGNDILYVYGGGDTWSGCAVHPTEKTNALKFVKAKGSHSTRIHNLSEEDQAKALEYLNKRIQK